MSQSAQQPQMNLVQTPDFRESYANSVQVRVSVWDFQLVFGLASSDSPDQITIRNQNAIYPPRHREKKGGKRGGKKTRQKSPPPPPNPPGTQNPPPPPRAQKKKFF